MSNNTEFLKCQHCERFFFTKTGFKNHNMKEHHKEEGSFVVSIEEKSLNLEGNNVSQTNGNSQKKNESEMIQIGKNEESSENTSDIEGIKIKSSTSTSKYCNKKTENNIIFLRQSETQSTKLIENILIKDTKFLRVIEEAQTNENNSLEQQSKKLINSNEKITDKMERRTQDKNVHKGKQPKCPLCEKSFSREHSVKLHIATVHEKQKPYKCHLCKKSFSREPSVKLHIATVHEKQTPYKCHLCDKSFSREHSVKPHIATVHEGQRPYKCHLCQKKFTQKYYVKNHIRSVHEKLKPFRCNLCDKQFSKEGNVKLHIEAIHEKLKP